MNSPSPSKMTDSYIDIIQKMTKQVHTDKNHFSFSEQFNFDCENYSCK